MAPKGHCGNAQVPLGLTIATPMSDIGTEWTLSRLFTAHCYASHEPQCASRCLILVRCRVYPELRPRINTLGVICVVLGVSLFAGTKRETLWDGNNLVGLLLVGFALSTHGGFDTILRSSPHATFSGYVLGWDRSSGDAASASGRIWLYDLGYPPAKDWVDAPYRAVYIPAKRTVPDAAWNTDRVWLLRTTYRTRDLQAVRIEGEPFHRQKHQECKHGLGSLTSVFCVRF